VIGPPLCYVNLGLLAFRLWASIDCVITGPLLHSYISLTPHSFHVSHLKYMCIIPSFTSTPWVIPLVVLHALTPSPRHIMHLTPSSILLCASFVPSLLHSHAHTSRKLVRIPSISPYLTCLLLGLDYPTWRVDSCSHSNITWAPSPLIGVHIISSQTTHPSHGHPHPTQGHTHRFISNDTPISWASSPHIGAHSVPSQSQRRTTHHLMGTPNSWALSQANLLSLCPGGCLTTL
jgi:hypothetical protein